MPNNNIQSMLKPGHSGTNAQKVKKQIQTDIKAGVGSMTSQEAGARRSK